MDRLLRHPGAVLALLGALLGCSTARTPSAPSSPAKEIETLAWTIGAWHGTRHEPSTGRDAPLRATIRPVLGGAGIEEELEIQGTRGPYRGLYLLVPDPRTTGWAMTYVNASRRQFVSLEGEAGERRAEWRST